MLNGASIISFPRSNHVLGKKQISGAGRLSGPGVRFPEFRKGTGRFSDFKSSREFELPLTFLIRRVRKRGWRRSKALTLSFRSAPVLFSNSSNRESYDKKFVGWFSADFRSYHFPLCWHFPELSIGISHNVHLFERRELRALTTLNHRLDSYYRTSLQ